MLTFSVIAVLCYFVATATFIKHLLVVNNRYWQFATISLAIALILHLIILTNSLFPKYGLNVNFYDISSLLIWMVTTILFITNLKKPLENLLICLSPISAIALILGELNPLEYILYNLPIGLQIHILSSICAYSLLAISALQGGMLLFQEYQLKERKLIFALRILPSLQLIEDLLIKFLHIGFILLCISLISGLVFLHNIMEQHLAHKMGLSILAWGIFGVIVLAHWLYGWRGKKIARWTISGFISLLLAYSGSKLVLELILQRV